MAATGYISFHRIYVISLLSFGLYSLHHPFTAEQSFMYHSSASIFLRSDSYILISHSLTSIFYALPHGYIPLCSSSLLYSCITVLYTAPEAYYWCSSNSTRNTVASLSLARRCDMKVSLVATDGRTVGRQGDVCLNISVRLI